MAKTDTLIELRDGATEEEIALIISWYVEHAMTLGLGQPVAALDVPGITREAVDIILADETGVLSYLGSTTEEIISLALVWVREEAATAVRIAADVFPFGSPSIYPIDGLMENGHLARSEADMIAEIRAAQNG